MHQLKRTKFRPIFFMAFFFLQVIALTDTFAVSSLSSLSSSTLSVVEKWIVGKILKGEIADLQLFYDEKQRIVSAEFLVKLITESRKNELGKPLKVIIANARFIEPIDLSNRMIHNETRLSNCIFDDFVNLKNAVSKVPLSFEGSKFKIVSFENATFEKVFILRQVKISESLNCSRAKFVYSEWGVYFEQMRVGGNALFPDAKFNGFVTFENAKFVNFFVLDRSELNRDVNFENVEIGGHFSSIKAKFTNQDNSQISFKGMKVGGDALFKDVVFKGEANFDNMDVGRKLIFSNTEFSNESKVISFSGTKVKSRVLFEKARFYGGADFTRVDFEENFVANNAQFKSHKKTIFFPEMRIGGTVYLNNTNFRGPVLFNNTDIKGYLLAQNINFENQTHSPKFIGIKVGEDVSFIKANFKANADFRELQCNFFNAEEAQFQNTSETMPIFFERMKVNNSVNLKGAKFSSVVKLDDIIVGRDLNAMQAQFTNNATVSVNRASIKGSASFDEAKFTNTVNFENSNFACNLYAKNTTFYDRANAFFRRVNINGSAFFDFAKFNGTVIFENSIISRFFSAQESEFQKQFIFKGMEIGYDAVFDLAKFGDSAIFDGTRVGLNFSGKKMNFEGTDARVSFEGMIVGEAVRFVNVAFAGTVNLKYANFRDLFIYCTENGFPPIKQISLERAQIQRQLDIKNVSFENLLAVSLKVVGPANLKGLIIRKKADLTHCSFTTLTLEDICLPKTKNSLILDGINYWSVEAKHISAQDDGNCQGSGETVIIGEEVEQSIKYDSSIYTKLEAFLKSKGDPDLADSVYIALKDREMEVHTPVVKGLYYLWALVAGYGRKPLNTLMFSVFVIAIGCIVFRKKSGMIHKEGRKEITYNYNALWYSVDLFVPFVDLNTANAWMPGRERKFAPHWARLQRFLGLILVPIFLAALTGIIK